MEFMKLLKNKYNLVAANEVDASKILNILESYNGKEFYEYNEEQKITGFYSKKMVDFIKENFTVINFYGGKDDNYYYHNGCYKKGESIREFVRDNLSNIDKHRMRNVKESLEDLAMHSYVDPDLINSNQDIINFRNGILDIKKMELLPHSPKILSTIQLNAKYVPYENNTTLENKFNYSMFKKYIESSFSKDTIPVIQEIFGYALSSYTKAQKFFVFLGEGRNGKSVLLNVLRAFFEESYISAVELKDIVKPEFAARLHGKSLNICSDISNEYIPSTGLVKGLTGEDYIEVKPLYRDPFQFKNKARLIFSANELPSTSDKTFAFFRRLLIVPCTRIIEKRDMIKELSEKIIENELELVCSWAIEGLKRLIKNDFEFSETKEIKQAAEEYKRSNNSVESFIQDFCYLDKSELSYIPKVEFMEMYKQYCESENSKPLGTKNINSTMKEHGIVEKHTTLYSGRYWAGISWRETVVEFRNLNFLKGSKKTEHDIRKENLKVCDTEENFKEAWQEMIEEI